MGTAVPEGFVFSKDGRYLYGSSYFTGVSNIYRYELATEKLEAVSNADARLLPPAAARRVPSCIVLRYTAKGFVPTLIEAQPTEDLSAITFLGEQVATKYPRCRAGSQPSPSTMPYESQIRAPGPPTVPLRELSLESLIPIIEGYKNSVALGRQRALQRSARVRLRSASTRATAPTDTAVQGAAARRGRRAPHAVDGRRRLESARTSTTCSGRPSAASRATTATSATTCR